MFLICVSFSQAFFAYILDAVNFSFPCFLLLPRGPRNSSTLTTLKKSKFDFFLLSHFHCIAGGGRTVDTEANVVDTHAYANTLILIYMTDRQIQEMVTISISLSAKPEHKSMDSGVIWSSSIQFLPLLPYPPFLSFLTLPSSPSLPFLPLLPYPSSLSTVKQDGFFGKLRRLLGKPGRLFGRWRWPIFEFLTSAKLQILKTWWVLEYAIELISVKKKSKK